MLATRDIGLVDRDMQSLSLGSTVQELPLWNLQIELAQLGQDAIDLFEHDPMLPGILLMEQRQFKGMISRRQFFECMSRPYSLELFSKRPLYVFNRVAETNALVLSQDLLIVDAYQRALGRSLALVYEPIVIQTETAYALLDVYQLLLAHAHLHSLATTALQQSETVFLEQENRLRSLVHNQTQLVQTEKMSSLGQLVAGVAHEINNPVNFIFGNILYADNYVQNLQELVELYQKHFPDPGREIQEKITDIELNFVLQDLPKVLVSIRKGAERIQKIVHSLRSFSRLDEAEMKFVDIHEGIDSALDILQSRLQVTPESFGIQVIKNYGDLPLVECYASQLNQALMNILVNAIEALDGDIQQRAIEKHQHQPNTITIQTQQLAADRISIAIADNGSGMSDRVRQRLFDPFFTTKPVGKGTGLGLSISYQIVVEKHSGSIRCTSELGQGTEFWIEIPIRQTDAIA